MCTIASHLTTTCSTNVAIFLLQYGILSHGSALRTDQGLLKAVSDIFHVQTDTNWPYPTIPKNSGLTVLHNGAMIDMLPYIYIYICTVFLRSKAPKVFTSKQCCGARVRFMEVLKIGGVEDSSSFYLQGT